MILAMKRSSQIAACASLGLLVVLLAFPAPASAAEKGRAYAGLVFSFGRTSGSSFDGRSGTEISGVFAAIPKPEAATGYGALIGIRGNFFGAEISYVHSPTHGSVFDPTPQYLGSRSVKAAHDAVNIDFKFHFWTERVIGAYACAGLSINFLNVKNSFFGQEATGLKPGSWTEYNYVWKEYGGVTYFGVGLNLGAGLEVNVSSRLSFNAGILFRPIFYSSLDLKPYDQDFDTSAYDFTVSDMTALHLALTVGLQFALTK